MAKRRLLQWMRDKLNSYASDNVAPIAETRALAGAYKKAEPLVRKMVEAEFKPADMLVCEKYKVAYRAQCIRLQFPNGVVTVFNFDGADTAPFVVHGGCYDRMYLADERTAAAVEIWIEAAKTLKIERDKRLVAYRALVDGSNNLDDIITVWPEVAALFPPENALIPLGPEQIELVRADIKERKAA